VNTYYEGYKMSRKRNRFDGEANQCMFTAAYTNILCTHFR